MTLLLRFYAEGKRPFEEVRELLPVNGKHTIELAQGVVEVGVDWTFGEQCRELRLTWTMVSGAFPQCAPGICIEHPGWSTAAYAWMAGAVYDGNRFTVRSQPYSPRYPEPDAETIITDIPHLEKGTGLSRIQLLTGDLSAPAMGYVDPETGQGIYLCTEQIDPADLFEVEEADDRTSARFTVLRGGCARGTLFPLPRNAYGRTFR